ncbi:hypothetical protein AB4Y42_40875 [Paraburkholderia sp. EG286B]|uniref:hypothetical protein n=1 Tax=Paraburkholderia sp. EG286B TaxID=3237011 RepID=UPI0034D25E23
MEPLLVHAAVSARGTPLAVADIARTVLDAASVTLNAMIAYTAVKDAVASCGRSVRVRVPSHYRTATERTKIILCDRVGSL